MGAWVGWLLSLCALALLAACSGEAPPAPKQQGGPALWRVQKGALDGWLFGTIHVLPSSAKWQTPAIEQAMAGADRLVIEAADIADEQKTLAIFEKMARSPDLPPLNARVPADERAGLEALATAGGSSTAQLSGYESWAAAMLLSAAAQQALHLDSDAGVEQVLVAAFRKGGKPIAGLETVERQFSAFDTLPEANQRRLLVQTVHEAKDLKGLYDRILTAWLKGDMAAIAKEDAIGEQPDPLVEEAVLVARNRDWVEAMEALKGKPFIAVGAGHLTGRQNLIEMLQARGFAVTRVQ